MPQIVFAKSGDHTAYAESQILAIGVYEDENQERKSVLPVCEFTTATAKAVETVDAAAKVGTLTKLVIQDALVFAVGLGSKTREELRQGAGSAARAAAGKESLTIEFPHNDAEQLAAIIEGAFLGAYNFTKYLADADAPVAKITIITDLDLDTAALAHRAEVITTAVNHVRDLTNTPANELNPQTLTDFALAAATAAGLEVKVYADADLTAEKLAGLAAVGRGSSIGPRLVRLAWNPQNARASVALVGKGITFDTGGYSLKPAASMTEMKTDMCGAAVVLETVIAAALLALPVKVVGWLCIAENMVSGHATRPDDVITYRNGKSVEINNTDAEGRLVMADGLIMACEERPDVVIDVATLTGAQMVALGERITGIMGTAQVRDAIVEAAEKVDEAAWAMPLPEQLRESLQSDIATMKNSGSRFGGMLVAGLFLQEFVGDTPWAHLDIAGPSFNRGSAYGHTPKGGTGVMLRTLVQFIESQC
ncbi:leucyl aminopeptidase [Arcanobacterium hippocoleae]|uniref:leucyl aminopeptidase n=1 Tax=Arcanobacterium hippocoleae TaxID=149017 RepID=UPI0033414BA8